MTDFAAKGGRSVFEALGFACCGLIGGDCALQSKGAVHLSRPPNADRRMPNAGQAEAP
jgi:hypothetical protein